MSNKNKHDMSPFNNAIIDPSTLDAALKGLEYTGNASNASNITTAVAEGYFQRRVTEYPSTIAWQQMNNTTRRVAGEYRPNQPIYRRTTEQPLPRLFVHPQGHHEWHKDCVTCPSSHNTGNMSDLESDTDEEDATSASKKKGKAHQSKGKGKGKETPNGTAGDQASDSGHAGPAREPENEEREGPQDKNTETPKEAVERLNKQLILLWRERLAIIDPQHAITLEGLIEHFTTQRQPHLAKTMGLDEKDRRKEWAYMQLTKRNQDIHQLWTKSRANPKTQLGIDRLSSERKQWLESLGEEDVPIELDGFVRPEDRPVAKDIPIPQPPPAPAPAPAPPASAEPASDPDSMSDLFGSDDDDLGLSSDSDTRMNLPEDVTESACEDPVSVPQDQPLERAAEIRPSIDARSQNNADNNLQTDPIALQVPTPQQAPSDAVVLAPEPIILDQGQTQHGWPSDLFDEYSGFQYSDFQSEGFDGASGDGMTNQATNHQDDNLLVFFEDPADTSAARGEQSIDSGNAVLSFSDDTQPFVPDNTIDVNTASGGQELGTEYSTFFDEGQDDHNYAFSQKFSIHNDTPAPTLPTQQMGQPPESQARSAQQLQLLQGLQQPSLPIPATPSLEALSTSSRKRKKSQLQASKAKRMKLAEDKQKTFGAAVPATIPVDFSTFQRNAQQAALQNHQQRASVPALIDKHLRSNGFFNDQWAQLGQKSTPAQLSGEQINILSSTQQGFQRRVSTEKPAAIQQDQANSQGMPPVQGPSHRQNSHPIDFSKAMQDTRAHQSVQAIKQSESSSNHGKNLVQPASDSNDNTWSTTGSYSVTPAKRVKRSHAGRPPKIGLDYPRRRPLKRVYEDSEYVDEHTTHQYARRTTAKTNNNSSGSQGSVPYAANPQATLGLNTSAEQYVQNQQARKAAGPKTSKASFSSVPGFSGNWRPVQAQAERKVSIPSHIRQHDLLPKPSHMVPIPHGAQIPANSTAQQAVPRAQEQQFASENLSLSQHLTVFNAHSTQQPHPIGHSLQQKMCGAIDAQKARQPPSNGRPMLQGDAAIYAMYQAPPRVPSQVPPQVPPQAPPQAQIQQETCLEALRRLNRESNAIQAKMASNNECFAKLMESGTPSTNKIAQQILEANAGLKIRLTAKFNCIEQLYSLGSAWPSNGGM